MTDEDKAIGHALKMIRIRRGLTQLQLSQRLHTTQSFVSRTESGRRSIRVAEAIAYAVALDIPPRDLYSEIHQAQIAAKQNVLRQSAP